MPTPSNAAPRVETTQSTSTGLRTPQSDPVVKALRTVEELSRTASAGRQTRDGYVISTIFTPGVARQILSHGDFSLETLRAQAKNTRGSNTATYKQARIYEISALPEPFDSSKGNGQFSIDVSKVETSTASRPRAPQRNGAPRFNDPILDTLHARADGAFNGFVGEQNGLGFSVVEAYADNSHGKVKGIAAVIDRLNIGLVQRFDVNAQQHKTIVGNPVLGQALTVMQQYNVAPRATQWVFTQEAARNPGTQPQQIPLLPRGSIFKDELNAFDIQDDPAEVGVKYVHDEGPPPKVRGYMVAFYAGEPPNTEVGNLGPADGSRALTRQELMENAARKFTNALNRFPNRKPVKNEDGEVVGVNVIEFLDDALGESINGEPAASQMPPIPCWMCIIHFEDTNPDLVQRVKQDENKLGLQLERAKTDGEDGLYHKGLYKKGEFKYFARPSKYALEGAMEEADMIASRAADDGIVAEDGRVASVRTFRPIRRFGKNVRLVNWEFCKFLANRNIRNPGYEDNGDSTITFVPTAPFYGVDNHAPRSSRFLYATVGVDRDVQSGKKSAPVGYQFVAANSSGNQNGLMNRAFSAAQLASLDSNQINLSTVYAAQNGKWFPRLSARASADVKLQSEELKALRLEGNPAAEGLFQADNRVGYFLNDRSYVFDFYASYHEQAFLNCMELANWFNEHKNFKLAGASFQFEFSTIGQFINTAETAFRDNCFRLGWSGKMVLRNPNSVPKLPKLDDFGEIPETFAPKRFDISSTNVEKAEPLEAFQARMQSKIPQTTEYVRDKLISDLKSNDPFIRLGLNYEALLQNKASAEEKIKDAHLSRGALVRGMTLPIKEQTALYTKLNDAASKAKAIVKSPLRQVMRGFFSKNE